MSDRSAVAPAPPPARPGPRARHAALGATTPQGVPVRRRWSRFAAGAVLALLGGWVSASLYLSAGSRVGVLVAADDIAAYQTLTRDDLRTVRVAADEGVETISAGDADALVGRAAATDIPGGTLLSPSHFFAEDQRLVAAGEATVGAEVGPGDSPGDALVPGTDVLVVLPPPQGDSASPPEEVAGWVLSVGDADDQSGDREVELVVPRASAADVAAAADRLRVVVLDGG